MAGTWVVFFFPPIIFTQLAVTDHKVSQRVEGNYCKDPGRLEDFINQGNGYMWPHFAPWQGKHFELLLHMTIKTSRR